MKMIGVMEKRMVGLSAMLMATGLSAAAAAAAEPAGQDGRRGDSPATNTVHTVRVIDVKEFGSGVLRVGDLNGDGAPDLLLVQAPPKTRSISCLTAVTIQGDVIWQVGKPAKENAYYFGDLPVQIHDWDHDGRNEVLYVIQAVYAGRIQESIYSREGAERYEGDATVVVLDATTGLEKKRFPIPAPADDVLLFADLTGRGWRQDLVVKNRYTDLWGISFEGKQLWHWRGSTGHCPAIADIDGDGKDEVFEGYVLLDHDGKVLFNNFPKGRDPLSTLPHPDSHWALKMPDGSWRLLFGNHGAHCLKPDGTELWLRKTKEGFMENGALQSEAQHVVVGKFRSDSLYQAAVIGRGMPRDLTGTAGLYLFDVETGKEIWSKKLSPGSWGAACRELDWSGAGQSLRQDSGQAGEILVYGFPDTKGYALIYNGNGEVVDTLPIPWKTPAIKASGKEVAYCTRANLWGDSRHEVIIFGGGGIVIYSNARPLAIPTHYNETVYTGM